MATVKITSNGESVELTNNVSVDRSNEAPRITLIEFDGVDGSEVLYSGRQYSVLTVSARLVTTSVSGHSAKALDDMMDDLEARLGSCSGRALDTMEVTYEDSSKSTFAGIIQAGPVQYSRGVSRIGSAFTRDLSFTVRRMQ